MFATARRLDKIQHLKALGLDVLPLDVTVTSSIDDAMAHVRKETGGTLDVLVNNAAFGKESGRRGRSALLIEPFNTRVLRSTPRCRSGGDEEDV